MFKLLLNVLFALVFVSCTHKATVKSEPTMNEAAGLEGSIIWLKNKPIKAKLDINLSLKNTYHHPIVVDPDSINVNFNNASNNGVKDPNDRILLKKGESSSFIVTFKFRSNLKAEGQGEIVVKNIYSYDLKKDKKGKKLKNLKIPFTTKPFQPKSRHPIKNGKIKSGTY